MRIKKRLAVPVFALLAVLVLGTGLMATGTISSIVGWSSSKPTYTELPTKEQLEKDLSYVPIIPAEFSNGYAFQEATVGTAKGLDDNDNVIDKHKNIYCSYKNGTEEINLHMAKWSYTLKDDDPVVETYEDIELQYSNDLYKGFPGDYVLTEQDKADEASG
ncbi:MAG: hypothetical protein Q4C00_05305 [Bacillota bacterium]|nr:hypothetical protein [Bacillota bacterium]